MFSGCSKLKSLDLTNFDTSDVVDMSYLFLECRTLDSLEVGSFNTEHVTAMPFIFCGCANIKEIDLSNFDMTQVENNNYMFEACDNLTTIVTPEKTGVNNIILPEGEWYIYDSDEKIINIPGNTINSITIMKKNND